MAVRRLELGPSPMSITFWGGPPSPRRRFSWLVSRPTSPTNQPGQSSPVALASYLPSSMAASTTHQRGGGRVPVVTCTASNGYDSLQQVMMARTTSRRSNDDDDDDDRLLMADESSRLLSTPRLQHHSKNDDEVELVDHHAAHDRCSTAGDHVSARSPPPSSPPDSSTRGRHPLLCWRYHHHHRRRHTAAAGGGGRRGGGGDGSSTSTIATRGGCGGLRRHTLRCAAMASILVSFLCVIVALLQVIPSHHELNLAYDQSLSVWSVGRIREAQSLALQSAHFLNKNNANAAGGGGGGEEEEEPEYWSLRAMHNLMKIGQGNGLRNHKAGPPPRKYMEPPEGCESTVLIVRHCEKGSVREHCAHVGFERAVYLATQFGSHPHERWPSPSYIFAEGPGERRNTKKMNFREIETVGPLSEKVGVKVDDRCVQNCMVVGVWAVFAYHTTTHSNARFLALPQRPFRPSSPTS